MQTVEQTGLIGPLTRHVLEQSISECAAWRRDGRALSVAVNLSVRNLLDRDLPREIERMLDSFGVPADALQLEITESMIMTDPERALATVSRLSDLGVRLSVDDFGTGYSSLANLRRLPIDELKIDRSFVSPMLQDESDLIIVRSTINLGHDLGLRIIAEGVEDAPTLERLATLGCDSAQGYHLSRPMSGGAFSTWLEESPLSTERTGFGPLAAAGRLRRTRSSRPTRGGPAAWCSPARLISALEQRRLGRRRGRSQALGSVVAGVVDGEPDLGERRPGSRQAGQDLRQSRRRRGRVQPLALVRRIEDHRHAVVEGGDRRIGGRGEDRARAQDLVGLPVPGRPQPGEGEQPAVVAGDVKRLLCGPPPSDATRRTRRRRSGSESARRHAGTPDAQAPSPRGR